MSLIAFYKGKNNLIITIEGIHKKSFPGTSLLVRSVPGKLLLNIL